MYNYEEKRYKLYSEEKRYKLYSKKNVSIVKYSHNLDQKKSHKLPFFYSVVETASILFFN